MTNAYRTPFSYFDLIETFPKPGCAVCTLTRRDVEKRVDLMLYGFVSTDDMQAIFSAARGLCPHHGEMVRRNKLGNVIGIARLYAATLNTVLDIMDQAPETGNGSSASGLLANLRKPRDHGTAERLADLLEPEANCPICDALEEFEAEYTGIFKRYLNDERFQSAFRASDGLCLPHFRQVIRQMNGDEARLIAAIQSEMWRDLKTEIEVFLDKQNYEHLDEVIGDEGDSWARAIARMAGAFDIFGLRRRKR